MESNCKTLKGDRDIEYEWVISHVTSRPKQVLDFGCGASKLTSQLAHLCEHVIANDLRSVEQESLPNLKLVVGDILRISLPEHYFDLIVNCSTIEHVGLGGRYGVKANDFDADLRAMAKLFTLIKPDGKMILTLPVGQDAVFEPLHRVYGERLNKLLTNWEVIEEKFYTKYPGINVYVEATKDYALTDKPTEKYYSLGLFVLKPNTQEQVKHAG